MRRRVLALALVAAALVGIWWVRSASRSGGSGSSPPASAQGLPDFGRAAGWINGGPLGADSLAGRPVVIVIWSDLDPRALEALPVVETWHRAYARYGLRVVGLYTPDFVYGADPAVPARIAKRLEITFPVALDPGYRVRGALEEPREPLGLVLADAAGRVVMTSGFDGLAAIDARVRVELSREKVDPSLPPESGARGEPAVSTPPRFVFLGTARVDAGPLREVSPGRAITFTTQFRHQEEGEPWTPYPVGRWTPSAEGLTAERGGAANFVAFRAPEGDVSIVAGPAPEGPSRVWLLSGDGWIPEGSRGEDVRADPRGATYIDVTEPRLHHVLRGASGRVLRVSPESRGVTLYAFVCRGKE